MKSVEIKLATNSFYHIWQVILSNVRNNYCLSVDIFSVAANKAAILKSKIRKMYSFRNGFIALILKAHKNIPYTEIVSANISI